MKYRFPSIFLVGLFWCFAIGSVSTEEVLDFGGQVRALLGWEGPGDGALLEGEPSVWFRANLSPSVSLDLQARFLSTLDSPRLLDLEKGLIQVRLPRYPELDSLFVFKGGRQVLSDFSTYVFAHRVDGASFQWKFPFTQIEVSGGYTGWQPRQVSQIYLSKSDVLDSEDSSVTYTPPRLVEMGTFTFPELLFAQDVYLSIVSQQDLRTDAPGRPPARTDRIHTNYVGLGSKGKILENTQLSLFGYLSLGFIGVSSRVFSGMYGASLQWRGNDRYRTEIEGVFVSASGDDRLTSIYDGATVREASVFLPISLRETGVAFSPLLANITFLQLRGGLFPLRKLWLEGKAFLFFRTTGGPISESGIDPLDRTDRFLGPELDIRSEWHLYSDVKIRSSFGFFLPATGTVGAFSRKDPWVKGTVEILFSF
ncbi:MAG: hypothetical protein N2442_13430 [Spirochaetes bacterium]|nr:hypothetical protein [Spirochaetota bacterium]